MNEFVAQLRVLDAGLLRFIPAQLTDWDRRALLALHAATADVWGTFTYLEIGSYLGGSLQAVVRDPRCQAVISLDPRVSTAPDERSGGWAYDDNTTEHMMRRLGTVPDADLSKVTTIEVGTEELTVKDLPCAPNLSFIDGEHTNEAVLRDARFCAEALAGRGVVAFHDYDLVAQGIRSFLGEVWRDASMAVAFTGGVLAVELGGTGILRSQPVTRAIDSTWHRTIWMATGSWRRSPRPMIAAWAAMPHIDDALAAIKTRWSAVP